MSEPVYGDRYSVPGVLWEVDRAEIMVTKKVGDRMFLVVTEINGVMQYGELTQEFLEDPICTKLEPPR